MEISFDTKELREQCSDEAYAAETLDSAVVEALKRRISDIRAADSIDDILAGQPRSGSYMGVECYFVDLAAGYQLIVKPAHSKPRVKADGSVDWDSIRRIKVVSLKP
ncbi:hypothetical protein QCN28_21815 [Bordetella bronchiseptica]|uniref:hypothetical protein n=1 Tax=Alcaligenaceae TaxID=506 RepID=UPI001F0FFAC4|nr:hypothetical protein [Achromobacter xylosoxidans]MCH4582657.1 hypothetical protein [Achromobacter xylosoxidans]